MMVSPAIARVRGPNRAINRAVMPAGRKPNASVDGRNASPVLNAVKFLMCCK